MPGKPADRGSEEEDRGQYDKPEYVIGATGAAEESLRDVKPSDLAARRERLGDLLWRRARHVVTENRRGVRH